MDTFTGQVVNAETQAFKVLQSSGAEQAFWSLPAIFNQLPDCTSGWTRLKAGEKAQVMGAATDPPNRVRSAPSKSAELIGQIYPGTVSLIIEGPVCADGLVFWKVENSTIPGGVGWTAEGDGINYFLEPLK